MQDSLSNLVNNLCEVIHRIKCEYGHDEKKCETWGMMKKNVKLGELHTKCATEYVDDWEKFNETSLPEKEDF